MEIKINREIRNIKERVFMGLTFRQMGFLFAGLSISAAVYFLLRNMLDMSTLTALCALSGMPVIVTGFIDFQSLSGLMLIAEFIQSYFFMKHETVNIPENSYRMLLEYVRENSNEAVKKRKRRRRYEISALSFLFVIIVLVCSAVYITSSEKEIYEYSLERSSDIYTEIDPSFYTKENSTKVISLIEEMKKDMADAKTKDEADDIYESYRISIGNVDDLSKSVSGFFREDYEKMISEKDEYLYSIINEECERISSAGWLSELRSAVYLSDRRIQRAIYETDARIIDHDTYTLFLEKEEMI